MGSHFHTARFDGKLTKSELIKQYNALVDEERYEHGSGAYSGTFATLHGGLSILEKIFNSEQEASDHVEKNTDKWGSALAVQYKDVWEVITTSPTFNGKKFNSSGMSVVCLDPNDLFRSFGMKSSKCIATEFTQGGSKFVLADQLSEDQKTKLKVVLEPCVEENRNFKKLNEELKGLVSKAGNICADFTTEDIKSLKSVRKELLKTKTKRDKLLAKLEALDKRFGTKLYKNEMEDRGTKWFVGGWVSE
jgi:hypothetical protein